MEKDGSFLTHLTMKCLERQNGLNITSGKGSHRVFESTKSHYKPFHSQPYKIKMSDQFERSITSFTKDFISEVQ